MDLYGKHDDIRIGTDEEINLIKDTNEIHRILWEARFLKPSKWMPKGFWWATDNDYDKGRKLIEETMGWSYLDEYHGIYAYKNLSFCVGDYRLKIRAYNDEVTELIFYGAYGPWGSPPPIWGIREEHCIDTLPFDKQVLFNIVNELKQGADKVKDKYQEDKNRIITKKNNSRKNLFNLFK